MGDGGGDIVIKGGSVEIQYDDTLYPKNPGDPNKHANANRKITRIRIANEEAAIVFDSGEHPGGLRWQTGFWTQ
jgi:hypothetical protein